MKEWINELKKIEDITNMSGSANKIKFEANISGELNNVHLMFQASVYNDSLFIVETTTQSEISCSRIEELAETIDIFIGGILYNCFIRKIN